MRNIASSIMVLCCALCFCAEPDAAALIRNLDSDKFAIREKASKELLALGTKALPDLTLAHKLTNSAEVAKRLSLAIEILEVQATGGSIEDGYQLVLTKATENTYEALAFDLSLYNRSSDEKANLTPLHYSYQVDADTGPEEQLQIVGYVAVVKISQVTGEEKVGVEIVASLASAGSENTLAPGAKSIKRFFVPKRKRNRAEKVSKDTPGEEMPYSIPPGNYTLQILYTPYGNRNGKNPIESNVVRFKVEE
jgi:hypothetical protein